jgi:hypothetical protein
LDGGAPNAASCTVHKHRLTGLDRAAALKRRERRHVVQGQGRSLFVTELSGEREGRLGRRGHLLGVGPEAERDDPIARREPAFGRGAEDLSSRLPTKRKRQGLAHLILAAGHQEVRECDAGRAHGDDELRVRLGQVGKRDGVGSVLGRHLQGAHWFLLVLVAP